MNQHIDTKKIRNLRIKVNSFYKSHKRVLPWRVDITPYKIWVSEIMLQQTQVSRVIGYFEKFIATVPDCFTLSTISDKDLLLLWQGLGYNSRALRMKKAAQIIMDKYDGMLPLSKDDLMMLPGIGDYTSSAIITFSLDAPMGFYDTNIRRVLMYELDLPLTISHQELNTIALKICDRKSPREWYYALFDYGALVLTAPKTGIKSLTKQTPFKGSSREVRSKVLKILLSEKQMIRTVLEKLVADDRSSGIINKLIKENLIQTMEHNGAEILFID